MNTNTNGSIEQQIYSTLKSMGLNDAAVAGIMGNWKIESGWSPTALNPNEGAIGFAQWEGGRRQALDAYAQAHNMSETDPRAQLGYFQTELTGPYSSVLDSLKSVRDPGTAASIFDQHYEVSAGTTRQARIDAANAVYAQIQSGGFTGSGGNATLLADQQNISVPGWLAPFTGGLLNPGGNPIDPLKGIVQPITDIATFFTKITWMLNPSHFLQACLYVIGFLLIAGGLYIAVTGVGIERPG